LTAARYAAQISSSVATTTSTAFISSSVVSTEP
jgi:hypothetical protein